MGSDTKLIIENREEHISDWLMAEYSHSGSIWPGTLFTNVRDREMTGLLQSAGTPVKEDVLEYTGGKRCIILDHQSQVELKPGDFENADYIVVGGILGYDRPKGRTRELITKRFDPSANLFRNMGSIQLTIDSAVFVARAIFLGAALSELDITSEVELMWDDMHSTLLPYGYPIVDGKVLMTPGLVDIIRQSNSQRLA
jgi:ribosome biogenesis SPOUT family RNA methylase Rps3